MVLHRLDLRGVADPDQALPRPEVDGDEPVGVVREILRQVRQRGDAALADYAQMFDGGLPDHLRVPSDEPARAADAIDPDLLEALDHAHDRIEDFHRSQLRPPHRWERDGIVVEARQQPVDRAGCYVPGGKAFYPSSVLMTAVPARVAGVPEVVLCVPPRPDTGRIDPVTLAAAHLAGVDEIYAVGGAQAIGAMAYGTETIRRVDAIVGPGNIYVAIAKREVSGVVGIPAAFAGPSEIVVVADHTADAVHAAIDIVVQAEHGPGGLAWLVTWDGPTADAVDAEVAAMVAASPRSATIVSTLEAGGYAVVVDGPAEALQVANAIAPEHLQLMVAEPGQLLPWVRHAGAVFCGPLAPASLGDYAAGPSHVLPTNGTARFGGALTVDDFCKELHVVWADRQGFDALADTVETIARAEGLEAHARSIALRRTPT